MSLIKNKEELKPHFSSIDKDFNLVSLESFITDAEQEILVPYFGYDFFNVIDDAYNAGTIAGKQLEVFKIMQKAVVHLALLKQSDSGSFRISDSGYYVISTDKSRPVSDKKLELFKRGRREAGYQALEFARLLLEKNINEPDLIVYKNAPERLQHLSSFIYSSVEFTLYYKKVNNSAYLFGQLSDAMSRAERKYLAPVLGRAFFNSLKSKIADLNFTPAEKALLPYIKRALANYTMAEALPGLPVELDGTNLYVSSMPAYGNSENVTSKSQASPQQQADLVAEAMADGKFELTELEDYLTANAGVLPGYLLPASTEDVNINSQSNPTFFV